MDKEMNLIQGILAWEAYQEDTVIAYRSIFGEITGDHSVALVLSQLFYWYTPSNKNRNENKLKVHRKDNNGEVQKWVANSVEEWCQTLYMGERTLKRSFKVLEDMNILEKKVMKFSGIPTVHLRLKMDVLAALMDEKFRNKHQESDNAQMEQLEQAKCEFPENTSSDELKRANEALQIQQRSASMGSNEYVLKTASEFLKNAPEEEFQKVYDIVINRKWNGNVSWNNIGKVLLVYIEKLKSIPTDDELSKMDEILMDYNPIIVAKVIKKKTKNEVPTLMEDKNLFIAACEEMKISEEQSRYNKMPQNKQISVTKKKTNVAEQGSFSFENL